MRTGRRFFVVAVALLALAVQAREGTGLDPRSAPLSGPAAAASNPAIPGEGSGGSGGAPIAAAGFATLVELAGFADYAPHGGGFGHEDWVGLPGFALNGTDALGPYIDHTVLVYDFGAVSSVSSATLTITVDQRWTGAGQDPTILTFVWADDGVIQFTDTAQGAGSPDDVFTYASNQVRGIDVTAAVNAALATSQFVGIRMENSRPPGDLGGAMEGIHHVTAPPPALQFSEGAVAVGHSVELLPWGKVKARYGH